MLYNELGWRNESARTANFVFAAARIEREASTIIDIRINGAGARRGGRIWPQRIKTSQLWGNVSR
jgi:hypothetical protein